MAHIMKLKITLFLILLSPLFAQAKHLHTEKWYQERSCSGEVEYRLEDGKRVDCLTDTHAIEHDFADKVYECAGQALYYASQTGKKPGCKLIIESEKDCKYIKPLREINRAFGLNIKIWTVSLTNHCSTPLQTEN